MVLAMHPTDQPSSYSGLLRFTLPAERMDHNPDIYLDFKPGREKPYEEIWQPLHSLREELELDPCDPAAEPVQDQLSRRGFAVCHHQSPTLEQRGIDEQQTYGDFIRENADLIKQLTGADRVIVWNTVRRDGSVKGGKLKDRQRVPHGLDGSKIDELDPEPPALFAHVDQDQSYGRKICNMAVAGSGIKELCEDVSDPFLAIQTDLCKKFRRTMIVNIWRPVGGTVYTKPLTVADYRTLSLDQISVHESPFGCGMDLHHNLRTKWYFIPEQKTSEVLLLKCYDSLQGADGSALYGAHCAASEVEGLDVPASAKPRKSVEMRFVLVWQ
ncbi:hypothetical protein IE53DRAFT_91027 [Violaceomyces palustris]|uniref:Uncharacterized protein n=1 Tax=Violaceomyces palustris TaxID=1673888 RepID=A0ACD0NXS5_9BASI|nr:hypothetical protein IE53DRAFT_91027 [Violaceomyces palustris]